jgi:hypothetical protein
MCEKSFEGNVVYLRCRKKFSEVERQQLIAATNAWSNCVRSQRIEFGFSDEGEEYATVFDDNDAIKAHISFTKCRLFVDSKWFGIVYADSVEELISATMPEYVKPVYHAMIREKHA